MDANNISISSEKDKNKNISNIHVVNQNKSSYPSMTNNTTENINSNENNNNNSSLNIFNFINDMPFENLNDYYDIESSLFLKRVEKLNLKFYWTSECILNQQDIKYPYNKLFLILFKQISLYIEEIARLNKQLKQKNKNEKYFQIKIAQMKQKEKENMLNKQMLKNLQRDNKILEKKNEKNLSEIEKLKLKVSNNYKNYNFSGSNTTTNINYSNGKDRNKHKNFFLGSPKSSNNSMGFDSIITHGSVKSKNSNKMADLNMSNDNTKYAINVQTKIKNQRVSNSIDDVLNNKKNDNNIEIINNKINQYDEEIENLEIIEEILKDFRNKNSNNNTRNFSSNSVSNPKNNVNNTYNINHGKFKKDKIYNKSGIPIKKNFHIPHKSEDLSKK